ncbi:MAG: hypothetical protein P9L99_04285 [Candidatus Lernaella stagnicola]|nr:hypothetical protein [Candidatus Lernaella stagnicola]
MSKYFLVILLAILALLFACADGNDGHNGQDGQVVYGDDDADDDASDDDTVTADDDDATDDDNDDATPGDDDDDDDGLTVDDLFYADDCPELAECVVESCQDFSDPDSYALLNCSLQSCPDEYDACFGPYGTGECVSVLKCLEACLPDDCLMECMAPASYDELLEFAEVGICVEDNCPDALADPLGNIGCFLGVCLDPVATCCGGTIFGCM